MFITVVYNQTVKYLLRMPVVLLKDLIVRVDVGRKWFTRLRRTMLNDCLLGGDGKETSVDKGLMFQLFPELAAICFIGKAWDIQMSHIFLPFSERIKPQFVRLVFLLFKSFS